MAELVIGIGGIRTVCFTSRLPDALDEAVLENHRCPRPCPPFAGSPARAELGAGQR